MIFSKNRPSLSLWEDPLRDFGKLREDMEDRISRESLLLRLWYAWEIVKKVSLILAMVLYPQSLQAQKPEHYVDSQGLLYDETKFSIAEVPWDINIDLMRHELEEYGYTPEDISQSISLIRPQTISWVIPLLRKIQDITGITIIWSDILFFLELEVAKSSGNIDKVLEISHFLISLYPSIPMKQILWEHWYIKEI